MVLGGLFISMSNKKPLDQILPQYIHKVNILREGRTAVRRPTHPLPHVMCGEQETHASDEEEPPGGRLSPPVWMEGEDTPSWKRTQTTNEQHCTKCFHVSSVYGGGKVV